MASERRETIGERIASVLATYVGPRSARVAVETVARRTLHRSATTLTLADVRPMQDALRPMLSAFVGKAHADAVLARIAREVGL
jgi:hypothetical protein